MKGVSWTFDFHDTRGVVGKKETDPRLFIPNIFTIVEQIAYQASQKEKPAFECCYDLR